MKKRTLLISTILAIFLSLNAQAQVSIAPGNETELKSYPIDASSLLKKNEDAVTQYYRENLDAIKKSGAQKKPEWNFNIGTQKMWYSIDFTNNQTRYQVQSTCRAIGEKCYVFVEDSVWGTRVTQNSVDSVRIAFDNKTPANPNKGIYQTNVEFFGEPPNVDGDSRIIILLQNIKDGWNGTSVTGYVQGYFTSGNELTSYTNSNRAEIFFIDVYPLNLNTASGLTGGMSTLAHEFQHMIHWNYHQTNSQISFINEGCSLVAEVNCGYPIDDQSRFVKESNHYLLDWRPLDDPGNLTDYSRSARFHVYLRDQFGIELFKKIVQNSYIGIQTYTDAFQKAGYSISFDDVFVNWTIANILDDRSINPAYGYIYSNLPKPNGIVNINPNVAYIPEPETYSNPLPYVSNLGAQYITYKSNKNLRATFKSSSSNLKIKAILKGSSGSRVSDVTPNVEFYDPDYGTKYSEMTFLLSNIDKDYSQKYNYSSAGSSMNVELKWDDTEPYGYLRRAPFDTVSISFDAVPDGYLDSVRIAVYRKGVLTGKVYEFSGAMRPRPFGKELTPELLLTSNSVTEVPYPTPFKNWLTADLRSYSIKTDKAFTFGFGIPADTSTIPHVMVITSTNTNEYHNYTYRTGLKNWYISINTAGDRQYLYMIRAYVSFRTNSVNQPVELAPKSFYLGQNYPNPFNPSTNIEFSIPKNEFVYLKIYNILGEEVTTLIADQLSAGKYKYNWDAAGITSGVYFYSLRAGQLNETRKLILLK
jgi:hypothetical protein